MNFGIMIPSVIILLLFGAGELAAEKYHGCFKDTAIRDLPIRLPDDINNTPTSCVKRCSYEGIPFAAVQNGNQCFCGWSYGQYGSYAWTTKCNMRCAGDSTRFCGGSLANSVYSSADFAMYMGCFKDEPPAYDLTLRLPNDPNNTPYSCISRCSSLGHAYASVMFGLLCFCGSSYGRYGPSLTCNDTCGGDWSLICGGGRTNAVYATGRGLQIMGCFSDQLFYGLVGGESNTETTFAKCFAWCTIGTITNKYAKYAALSSTLCSCLTVTSGLTRKDNSYCNVRCDPDQNFMCGGIGATTVFALSL